MDLARIESMPDCAVAVDTETDLIKPGNLDPELVCGSASWLEELRIEGVLLDKWQILETFCNALEDPDTVITGANIPFDIAVKAKALRELGVDAYSDIFRALEQRRVYDVQTAEALNAIADGHLGKDPRTGGPLINPETGKRGRYSLSTCVDLVLGRQDAKVNDEWRLRYGELKNIPIEEWPQTAREYPVDDTNNTLECALAQTGHIAKYTTHHEWGPNGACQHCGSRTLAQRCVVTKPHRNLHDLANQVWTSVAMHFGAVRGFRVNQKSVDLIEEHRIWSRQKDLKPFLQSGLVREDGSENRSELKRRVAIAYGAKDTCTVCMGTGKVPSRAAKPVRCPDCKGRCQPWKAGGKIKEPTVAHCSTCKNTGQVPNPNPPMVICHEVDVTGKQMKTCDGTGLVLHEDIPRSEKEGISYGRDTLHESGDEFLMSYGDFQEDAKDLNVYVPYLRTARVCANCGQHGSKSSPHTDECLAKHGDGSLAFYVYYDVPLTLRPNVVLETGRTSYDGVIQLFKRQPGSIENDKQSPFYKQYIPSLRECIEARPGFVLASVDYDSGELVTHAQSCLWIVGYSRLAEALKMKLKPHHALGATMIGLSYDEFLKRFDAKDLFCKNARQAAKPPNFGYPGGMGAVKLVLQQRKQGPDTPHPSGPQWIMDGEKKVRGYKGLRFCLLMDNAEACGIRLLREFKGRKIPPTCAACINCALRLKDIWLKQWPENRQYFNFVDDCVKNGMVITKEALKRWPHLAEVFKPGQRLAPGEIMQHVSGRIRQVVTKDTESPFCSAANGFFQGLLGDLAKAAVRRISRECYDRNYRVPDFAHENSKKSKYGGGQSPLYGSHLIVFQHDEVIPELVESQAHDAAMRLSEIMIEEEMFYCPDLVPACKAPPALMRKWYKGAEPWYKRGGAKPADENDTLVPWEPKKAA